MTARRSGLTLIEVLVVTAVLVALAAIMAPTVRQFSRDSRVLAGADLLRGRVADARGEAMEHGRAYRLALSDDGTRVRIAPDDQGFDTAAVTTDEAAPRVAEDAFPDGVTAKSEPPDGSAPTVDADGWVRVATVQPDGTCREDAVVVRVSQPNMYPVLVRIRGLTGGTSVEPQKGLAGAAP